MLDSRTVSVVPFHGMLPEGMRRVGLVTHADPRGALTEILRDSWGLGPHAVQWNMVRSRPGTLRGVHVHPKHTDYWILVNGQATVGYRDLRDGSPTAGMAGELRLSGEIPEMLVIPPGVAHGFQFEAWSVHLYGVTSYWNMADELGCKWDDPELGISWPWPGPPVLSPRDAEAKPLRDLLRELVPHQATLVAPPPGP